MGGNDSQDDKHEKPRAKKPGAGRPPHQPTPSLHTQVRALAFAGLSTERIAEFVGLDSKTLTKYYGVEIRNARPLLLAKAASNIIKNLSSTDEDRAQKASMFVLKTVGKRLGWSEQLPSLGDAYAGLDMSKLTDEEFHQFYELLAKAGINIDDRNTPRGTLTPRQTDP